MEIENTILSAAAASRSNFVKIAELTDANDMSDKAAIIFSKIREFYDKDVDLTRIDLHLLKSALRRRHKAKADVLIDIIDGFGDVSIPNLLDEVIELKKSATAELLANSLFNGDDDEVREYIKAYTDILDKRVFLTSDEENSQVYNAADLEEVFCAEDGDDGYALYPSALRKVTGRVLRGHHIVVFAPPEMGKTLLSINLAYGFLQQGLRVLYACNEEPKKDLLKRFVARLTGVSLKYLNARNNKKYVAKANRMLRKSEEYRNLIIQDLHPGTFSEIEGLIDKYNPDVLIVDQILKLRVKGADSELKALTKASGFMRTMGKAKGLISVSVTQAGESATGKLILEQTDVYMSNTAVPGDADLMIGFGANSAYQSSNKRMISLPKNKLSGDHAKIPVKIDPFLVRVSTIK